MKALYTHTTLYYLPAKRTTTQPTVRNAVRRSLFVKNEIDEREVVYKSRKQKGKKKSTHAPTRQGRQVQQAQDWAITPFNARNTSALRLAPIPPSAVTICGTSRGLSSGTPSVTLSGNGTCTHASLRLLPLALLHDLVFAMVGPAGQYGFAQHSGYRRWVYPLFIVEAVLIGRHRA